MNEKQKEFILDLFRCPECNSDLHFATMEPTKDQLSVVLRGHCTGCVPKTTWRIEHKVTEVLTT